MQCRDYRQSWGKLPRSKLAIFFNSFWTFSQPRMIRFITKKCLHGISNYVYIRYNVIFTLIDNTIFKVKITPFFRK